MTKRAIDPATGIEGDYPIDTPTRKTGNLRYLSTPDEIAVLEAKDAAALAEETDYIANRKWADDRNKARGSIVEQWEYFIDNGYAALRARDDNIKAIYPKPVAGNPVIIEQL